jgi:hypothetical protein
MSEAAWACLTIIILTFFCAGDPDVLDGLTYILMN